MKGLIFDMDGVLIDVSKSYRVAIKKTAEFFLNKKISFETIQKYKEKGGLNNDWDCTQAILRDNGLNIDKKKIIKKFDEIYLGGTIDNEKLIVDRKLLNQLSKKYKLGLLTGRPKRDAVYTLNKFDLEKFFQEIVTLDDVSKGKPDPEGILKVMKRLEVSEAYYLGDTVDDMETAVNADIKGIGIIPPGVKDVKTLTKLLTDNGAVKVLNSVNDIAEVIK